MDADLQFLRIMSRLRPRLAIQIHQRPKSLRFASDDRDHQRQPQPSRPLKRRRRSADTQPNRKRFLYRPRIDALPGQCWPVLSAPIHMGLLTEQQQQIQFLGEKRFVILQFQPEQRKRFDE